MASVVPDPKAILAFRDQAAFEKWLSVHHDEWPELWLKIHKKGSGLATVTYAEALEVALCWGWIDGLKKSYDDRSFLQRFTPRKAKSIWSKINVEHVARLEREGRMTAHGRKHVLAAQADGRWAAAYAGSREAQIPEDLRRSIEADPRAAKTFLTLNAANRYAMAHRVLTLKTEAGRQKRIAELVRMLAEGRTLHPNGSGARQSQAPRKSTGAARPSQTKGPSRKRRSSK